MHGLIKWTHYICIYMGIVEVLYTLSTLYNNIIYSAYARSQNAIYYILHYMLKHSNCSHFELLAAVSSTNIHSVQETSTNVHSLCQSVTIDPNVLAAAECIIRQ